MTAETQAPLTWDAPPEKCPICGCADVRRTFQDYRIEFVCWGDVGRPFKNYPDSAERCEVWEYWGGCANTDRTVFSLRAENERLRTACQGLLNYAQRNQRNWQSEKAADYIRLIEQALDAEPAGDPHA